MNSGKRVLAVVLGLVLLLGPVAQIAASDQPPGAGAGPAGSVASGQIPEVTPPRVSYIHGEVSFWRPGAEDWSPARLNTPLAPGDRLHTAEDGNIEIQVAPRAWVRAAERTDLGIEAHEPDYLQIRLAEGHAAIDLRELAPGHTVEIATPHGAFTIERSGYYRVDVQGEVRTAFTARRGGSAAVLAASGAVTSVVTGQRVVLTGPEPATLVVEAAPGLEPWDHWNYQRTGALLAMPAPAHVSASVYGAAELGQYGTWRTADEYGAVWIPSGVPAGWSPYSAGRWIWDPRYGWTWLDDAPWGWAPYHYGRWVYFGNVWAWAPGPIVVRPRYAPALVVFLGGPVSLGVGPVFWAPLGWGEPCIPWWGPRGFAGRPWWGGWGGPRVVNNVVIAPTIVVRGDEVRTFRNVSVGGAVVGVSGERFGRGPVRDARVSVADARALAPVRGALGVQPVAASLTPASGQARRPSEAVLEREVVTRRAARPQPQGLAVGPPGPPSSPGPAGRVVPGATLRDQGAGGRVGGARDEARPSAPVPGSPLDRARLPRLDRAVPAEQPERPAPPEKRTIQQLRPVPRGVAAPPPGAVAPAPPGTPRAGDAGAVGQPARPPAIVPGRSGEPRPAHQPRPLPQVRPQSPPAAAPSPAVVAPPPSAPRIQPRERHGPARPVLAPVEAPAARPPARGSLPSSQGSVRGPGSGPAPSPQPAPAARRAMPTGAAHEHTGRPPTAVAPAQQPAAPVWAPPGTAGQMRPGARTMAPGPALRSQPAPAIRGAHPTPSPAVRSAPGQPGIGAPASRPGAELRPAPRRMAPASVPALGRPGGERRGR